jgi:predicted RNA-binding protein YlxR (DUF448 family)
MRTCVGCRAVAPNTELVRVARDSGGALSLSRQLSGRGAWLCRGEVEGLPAEGCLDQAAQRQAFGRAFRVPVAPDAVMVLRETVEERARMEKGGAAGVAARRD